MRTGVTSICHEAVRRIFIHEDGRIENKEVRCNTPFENRVIEKQVCVSCGRENGRGHEGPDCVATGETQYLPVTAKGAFCAEGHPYPTS